MKERRKVELEVLEENNVRSELPPLDQGNKTHSAWEMESRRTHPFHGILYSVPQHINQQNQVASSNLAMQGLLGMHLSMFLTTSKSGSFSPN
ncbi:hypothetical protein JHK87_017741 [Glycine soja]|nr:hypothetical protein JHK87_017741 [Glycine soja]